MKAVVQLTPEQECLDVGFHLQQTGGECFYLSVRKAQMMLFASLEMSTSSGKLREFLWSMILLYVPTRESA